MIPQAEGEALIEAARGQDPPARGALVPMNCNKNSAIGTAKNQRCLAAAKADRDLVDSLTLVRLWWGTNRTKRCPMHAVTI